MITTITTTITTTKIGFERLKGRPHGTAFFLAKGRRAAVAFPDVGILYSAVRTFAPVSPLRHAASHFLTFLLGWHKRCTM
jgi:hypothetical protein